MPKLRETPEAYYVTPTFWESLNPVLDQLTKSIILKAERDREKRREAEEAELDAARLLLQLKQEARTDPEGANVIKDLPAIATLLDPKRAERKLHEGESLFTRWRKGHKEKHAELQLPSAPIPDFEVTPQLKAEREKAADDARKAKAAADLEQARTNAILEGVKKGDIAAQLKLLEIPFTPEGILTFNQKQRAVEDKYLADVPGSEPWIAKNTADEAAKLFKEFPGGNSEDLRELARSFFDPNKPLRPETRARLGKSESTQKLDIDKRQAAVAEGQLSLSRQRFQYEKNTNTFKIAQELVTNGIDPAVAEAMAASIIQTGRVPEGVNIPADLMEQAQLLKFADEHMDAQVRNPRFKALSDLVSATPEGALQDRYIQEMEKEFCKGAADNALCQPGKEGAFTRMMKWMNTKTNEYKLKLAAKSVGMAGGVAGAVARPTAEYVAGAGSTLGEAVVGTFTGTPPSNVRQSPGNLLPNLTGDPRADLPAAPAALEIPEEVAVRIKTIRENLQGALNDPGTPEATKVRLAKFAAELAAAVQTKDASKIMDLIHSMELK